MKSSALLANFSSQRALGERPSFLPPPSEDEKRARYLHCDELREQIAAREEKALQDRRAFLEEGNQIRQGISAERAKLERIKTRKIEELKKCGVPEKYWSELARKKISV